MSIKPVVYRSLANVMLCLGGRLHMGDLSQIDLVIGRVPNLSPLQKLTCLQSVA